MKRTKPPLAHARWIVPLFATILVLLDAVSYAGDPNATPDDDRDGSVKEEPAVLSTGEGTGDTVTGQFRYKRRVRVIHEYRIPDVVYREEVSEVLGYQYDESTGENEVVRKLVKVPIYSTKLVQEEGYVTEERCVTLTIPKELLDQAKKESGERIIKKPVLVVPTPNQGSEGPSTPGEAPLDAAPTQPAPSDSGEGKHGSRLRPKPNGLELSGRQQLPTPTSAAPATCRPIPATCRPIPATCRPIAVMCRPVVGSAG